MMNIFKLFSVIYVEYTKNVLPSPHVLVPQDPVLLLTCCIRNTQEADFSIGHHLFPVAILYDRFIFKQKVILNLGYFLAYITGFNYPKFIFYHFQQT